MNTFKFTNHKYDVVKYGQKHGDIFIKSRIMKWVEHGDVLFAFYFVKNNFEVLKGLCF